MKFKSIIFILVLIFLTNSAYAELIDRGGGLIYDTDMNITWLQDANYAYTSEYDPDGLMNRNDALAWADQLEYGEFDDWRLPSLRDKDGNYPDDVGYDLNTTEFGNLYYVELGNPSGGPLGNVYPFTNIPPPSPPWSDTIPYWSSTEIPTNPDGGRYFLFNSGQVGGGANWNEYYAWAVRDGDVIPHTHCVSNSDELQIALDIAATNSTPDIIRIRSSKVPYFGNFDYTSTEPFSLTLEGGYKDPHCNKRKVDPANTVLDGGGIRRVLTLDCSSEDADLVVDGLTLQNGSSSGGGGLRILDCQLISLTDNTITNNHADFSGGGLQAAGCDTILLHGNYISSNTTNTNAGGIYAHAKLLIEIENSVITNNNAPELGGGLITGGDATLILTGNRISGNYAGDGGGGIWGYGHKATLTNNIITNNTANQRHGGFHFDCFELSLINNTIVHNTCNQNDRPGGCNIVIIEDLSVSYPTVAYIFNNIIFGNSGTVGADLTIYNDWSGDLDAPVYLFNNNFDQSTTGTYIGDPSFVISGDNLNNEDPLFIDPANDDYHLGDGSPCIGAGTSSIDADGTLIYAPDDDIDGDSRPQGTDYDIGADEYVGTVIPEMLDLDIARFKTTKRVSVAGTVEISLAVANNGTIEDSCPATVIGVQDSVEVYNETIEVSDAIGKGPTTHDFPTFTPPAVGDILWTAIVEDEDPNDDDEATAGTTVNP
jgi:hypothetical protein